MRAARTVTVATAVVAVAEAYVSADPAAARHSSVSGAAIALLVLAYAVVGVVVSLARPGRPDGPLLVPGSGGTTKVGHPVAVRSIRRGIAERLNGS